MFKKIAITVGAVGVVAGGLAWFVSQRDDQKAEASGELRIVTTNSILEDMVEQVGGDDVKVYSIVKRGTDPHKYEPKTADITATTEANVIFHNGLNLETGGNGWFTKLTETANKRDGKEVFAASKLVQPMYLTAAGKEQETDPHAWLDLSNGIKYVQTITAVLKEKDP